MDLEKNIQLTKKYDVAVSIEVAEHLSPDSADTFVKSICNAADVILFSAAFVGQGGYKHINEQYPSYWKEKFAQNDYTMYDVIRPAIWYNSNVENWHKNNVFLVQKNILPPLLTHKLMKTNNL